MVPVLPLFYKAFLGVGTEKPYFSTFYMRRIEETVKNVFSYYKKGTVYRGKWFPLFYKDLCFGIVWQKSP